MTENLFVYGSLACGMVHWGQIKEFVRASEPVRLTGRALRLPCGYPVYLEDGNDSVPMEWVRLEGPALLFQLLEQLHGMQQHHPERNLFFKRTIQGLTLEGQAVEAQVFVANRERLPSGCRAIEGGDWRQDMRLNPALTNQLSERQSTYLRRLSGSSGREIVPIDMVLYRELIKLELIVDKGRRLALTKLGKEVCRYLS